MKRVQIRLTDTQLAILRNRAAAVDRPVAALVRDAVDKWIADDAERGELVDRALAAVGGFHSGIGDLSENHDAYFVEAIEERIRR